MKILLRFISIRFQGKNALGIGHWVSCIGYWRWRIGVLLMMVVMTSWDVRAGIFEKEPDSVYLFTYATAKDNNRNGLHVAWSTDRKSWFLIGPEWSLVRNDYGNWGTEKRMISPYVIYGADGLWHGVWSVNDRENLFAHAASADLIHWQRQNYPTLAPGEIFQDPSIRYEKDSRKYLISFTGKSGKRYRVTTSDFKTYSAATAEPAAAGQGWTRVTLPGGEVTGQVHRVSWSVVNGLLRSHEGLQYRQGLYAERAEQDARRFAGLKPVDANFVLTPNDTKPISELLIGAFFEDINYAADGGLYAELIQNRDFEYRLGDKQGHDTTWHSKHAWSVTAGASLRIDTVQPLHAHNPHYAVVQVSKAGGALVNAGFDGIAVRKGEVYELSLFARQVAGKPSALAVRLTDKHGAAVAAGTLKLAAAGWKKLNVLLTASADVADARLELLPAAGSTVALDVVSLFPQKTFLNRKNGLRADLAQTIADLHPRFIRFPGGCVAHGDGLDNIYQWKNTVGPLETRVPQRNLWGYHQTAGLGYFEYFQYCEDIGAQPLPVVAAGVPCQNSSSGPHGGGQQGGIPLGEMDEYIQDVLDLIDYANGSATSTWGKLRAQAGHPKPFNLKYIGIGNEDMITDVFEERFRMIYAVVKSKHPEITIIGTVGPWFEGTDYEEGWTLADQLQVPMVDEHYYQSPGWFIYNQQFYDRYDRSKSKVYLGEYASHLPGRASTIETALSEALYLTALERNGDVVRMASYAPLLAKEGHTQWSPDLIYFNNTTVKPTVGYQVQKLFGQNSGTTYITSRTTLSDTRQAVASRVALSVVRDAATKDLIVKLVNMLPVAVNTSVDLGGMRLASTTAGRIVLQGEPADRDAKPAESTVAVSNRFNETLAPYSFTVIRIKTL